MAEPYNLISIFEEKNMQCFEGIDFGTFVSLKPEHIKEAIPALVPRIKFENQFKTFLKTIEKDKTTIATTKTSSVVDESESVTMVFESNETGILNYNDCIEPGFDKDFSLYNVAAPSGLMNTKIISNSENQLITAPAQATVIKTVQDIVDIPDIDLKILITKYVSQKKLLDNSDRIAIGNAIIRHTLVNDFERKVTREEFIGISEVIVQLFPTELKGTYYTPAVKNFQAQGKLYSSYQNYKTKLREVGLINKREKALSKARYDKGLAAEITLLVEKSEALKFVLENDDDFEQIKDCWQLCFNERQKLLKEFSLFEYMHKFPSFDLQNGYELLQLDADTLHVSKNSKLLQIAPKIIKYASKQKKKTLEVKTLLAAQEELAIDLDSIDALQQFTAIRLLPHLIPNPKRKYSTSEIASLFCPHFKTAFEADAHNTKFNKEYKESTVVLKPRLYFVGDVLDPSANINIAGKKYICENSINGFEILFKSFLALNCGYPDQTQHIWNFIQKEVYGIEIAGIKQNANVEAFIQDIAAISL